MAQNEIKRVFIIGGSSGSFDVILKMLPLIQPLTSSAIILVLHRKSSAESSMADVFSSRTHIAVKEAEEKEVIEIGNIYIAPANYHLLVEKDGSFSLDVSEKINYSRPSIDVSFETAAEAYKEKLVCILLSGANADGAKGMQTAKRFGSTNIAQNPATADVGFMPQQAIQSKAVDYIMSPAEIVEFINNNQ